MSEKRHSILQALDKMDKEFSQRERVRKRIEKLDNKKNSSLKEKEVSRDVRTLRKSEKLKKEQLSEIKRQGGFFLFFSLLAAIYLIYAFFYASPEERFELVSSAVILYIYAGLVFVLYKSRRR